MKKLALLLSLLAGSAFAQQPVYQYATPRNSVNASGTIAVTNTFQQVFAAASTSPGQAVTRMGCLIQNNSTHTMYVYFGPIANATLNTSIQLAASGALSCATLTGAVTADQISITGTAGDVFFAAQQ